MPPSVSAVNILAALSRAKQNQGTLADGVSLGNQPLDPQAQELPAANVRTNAGRPQRPGRGSVEPTGGGLNSAGSNGA